MNIFKWMMFWGLLSISALADEVSKMHSFTDVKGRSIKAQLIDVDIPGRRVCIQRENAESAIWIGVAALSQSDFRYIEEWYNSSLLMAGGNLLLSVETEEKHTRSKPDGDYFIKTIPNFAKLTFENSSGEAIEEFQVEYCYYISSSSEISVEALASNQMSKAELSSYSLRSEFGSFSVGTLTNQQVVVMNTEDVDLHEKFMLQKSFDTFGSSSRVSYLEKEYVAGIRFRVYGAGNNGVLAMREFSFPEALSDLVEWKGKPVSP